MAPPTIQNADLEGYEMIEKTETKRARADGDNDGAPKTFVLPQCTKEATQNECEDWEVVDGDESEDSGWVNVSKTSPTKGTGQSATTPTPTTTTTAPKMGFVRSSRYGRPSKSAASRPPPPPPPPSPDMMAESQILSPPPKRLEAKPRASVPTVMHQAPGRKAGVLPSWNDPPRVVRSGKCGTLRQRESFCGRRQCASASLVTRSSLEHGEVGLRWG